MADPKRAVHDDEAVVTLIAPATAQYRDDGRNLVNQAIRPRTVRVEQSRKAADVRARVVCLQLLVMIIRDARLPLLINARRRSEQHVIRAARLWAAV